MDFSTRHGWSTHTFIQLDRFINECNHPHLASNTSTVLAAHSISESSPYTQAWRFIPNMIPIANGGHHNVCGHVSYKYMHKWLKHNDIWEPHAQHLIQVLLKTASISLHLPGVHKAPKLLQTFHKIATMTCVETSFILTNSCFCTSWIAPRIFQPPYLFGLHLCNIPCLPLRPSGSTSFRPTCRSR